MRFRCGVCQKEFHVDPDWAGRRVMCRACGTAGVVVAGDVAIAAVVPRVSAANSVQSTRSTRHIVPVAEVSAHRSQLGRLDFWIPTLVLVYAGFLTVLYGWRTFFRDQMCGTSAPEVGFLLTGLIQPLVAGVLVYWGLRIASGWLGFPLPTAIKWRSAAVGCAMQIAPLARVLFALSDPVSAAAAVVGLAAAVGLLWLVTNLHGVRFWAAALLAIVPFVLLWLAVGGIFFLYQQAFGSQPGTRLETLVRTQTREIQAAHAALPPLPVPVAMMSDPVELMNRVAVAEQTFRHQHLGRYARNGDDLNSAGFPNGVPIEPNVGARIRFHNAIPAIAPLPHDFIVAWIVDADEARYTVLYGDWHTGHVAATEWQKASARSDQALGQVMIKR